MRSPTSERAELSDVFYRHTHVPMWVYDEETLAFLSVNDAAVARYGYSREEFLTMTIVDVRTAAERRRLLRALDGTADRKALARVGLGTHHVRRDGSVIEVEVVDAQHIVYEGRPAVAAIIFDVTERARHTARLAADRAALEEAHRAGGLGTVVLDLHEEVCHLYGRIADAYGRTSISLDEAQRAAMDRIHPEDVPELRRLLASVASRTSYEGELRMFIRGEPRWLRGRTRVLSGPDGRAAAIVCIAGDVSEAKAEEERLRRAPLTDAATGLPNRAALFDGKVVPEGVCGTFLLVRTDPGPEARARAHDVRSRNAAAVADKLRQLLPADARLVRYADKVFAIVLPPGTRRRPPLALAEAIVAAFEEPLEVGDDAIVLTPSVGIGFAESPMSVSELARRAGVALAAALRSHERYALFSEAFELAQRRRVTIDKRLREAFAARRIEVAYQPIVSLASGQIVGAEALMRWDCPGIGPIPPSEFIANAEESGIIVRLGEWIVREACGQAQRWERDGLGSLRIAVNVSARQVQQRDFVGFVKAVCSEMKTAPERLELEVTEHAMLDRGQGVRNLAALRSSGVRVVLDDFGTGYSSLSCLDEIPLDGVKIDQTFVAAIGSDSFKSLVVRNVISLAHALGLSVVGEGVERDEQLVQLRAMGCDQGQGYLFGPPMSGDAFAAFVATHSAKLP